jgi:Rieske Fe-S protein
MEPTETTDPPRDTPAAEPQRRSFLKKALAVTIGAIIVVVPAAAGLLVFFDPLRRKRSGGGGTGEFIQVATLDAVPADGIPRKFRVVADRTDAWNKYLQVPIGAVFLRRTADAAVTAFNVVCPHAGCFVDARPDGTYLCPCHNSTFNADGSLGKNSVSPRGLDELEVDQDSLRQGVVKIKFQNFRPAMHDKVPQ